MLSGPSAILRNWTPYYKRAHGPPGVIGILMSILVWISSYTPYLTAR